MQASYWRFAAMIATSTVVMFVLMYLTTYVLDHVYWSETRAWMALLMGAVMAVIMLGFMLNMYKKRAINVATFVGSVVVFALALWLVRSQTTVDDVDYMKAMIPHHSIAILTSTRAQISDPRVRKLADEIIAAQRKEIAEMKYLVAVLEENGTDTTDRGAAATPPRLVAAPEAVENAQLAKLDLAELDQAEIDRVLGPGPRCSFHYSSSAGPVLAATPTAGGRGVVKLNGRLVALDARFTSSVSSTAGGVALSGAGMNVIVDPGAQEPAISAAMREATARLHLGGIGDGHAALRKRRPHQALQMAELAAGYAGYYGCGKQF